MSRPVALGLYCCAEIGESVPPRYAELIGRAGIESIRREERA